MISHLDHLEGHPKRAVGGALWTSGGGAVGEMLGPQDQLKINLGLEDTIFGTLFWEG